MDHLNDVELQQLVSSLNNMSQNAREAVLATMNPQAQASLRSAGLVDNDQVVRSRAVREQRLSDINALQQERTTSTWTEAESAFNDFQAALMTKGFQAQDLGFQVPRWRQTFSRLTLKLERLSEELDALASRGMPENRADVEEVRAAKKAFQQLVNKDLATVENLILACDQLQQLFRTLNIFQSAEQGPLRGVPSV
jgi:hypothetical protein